MFQFIKMKIDLNYAETLNHPIFENSSPKQIASEMKHIGVPPAVLGHSAVPVNSPSVPVIAMAVTIPTNKKYMLLADLKGIR